ncbi:MAG: NAD(P)/FAD-dependent oxidoreductase [Acidimicrobiia bacterium]|nr:NAD(P)/FAD-dependent oxidoreductase [Acidimicrobiia bacterium]
MARIAIVGDGPGGLSAALFLAKNGQDVTVYGTDETAMHFAYLYNYLGIPEIDGSAFQEVARGQVAAVGAELRSVRVESVDRSDDGFTVTPEGSEADEADYLILTEGKNPELARSLGLEETDDGIAHDREFATSIDGVYVLGRAARRNRSQAIISAGAGATAALDILSRIEGKNVQDWDTPPKDE